MEGEAWVATTNICTARNAEGKEGWRNADTLRTEIPPKVVVVAEEEAEEEEEEDSKVARELALELLLVLLVPKRPPLKLAVGERTLGGEMEENTPARAQSASMATLLASSPPTPSSPPPPPHPWRLQSRWQGWGGGGWGGAMMMRHLKHHPMEKPQTLPGSGPL